MERFFQRLYFFCKIAACMLIVLGVFALGVYFWSAPETWLGGLVLKAKYDPDDVDLRGVSKHLKAVNGGYVPAKFEEYLYAQLVAADEGSSEYRNILGFYAHQAKLSRAGSSIFETGDTYLESVISYGRSATDRERQLGFLFLAYGIAGGQQAYKPVFIDRESIEQSFDHIESGEYAKVGIISP